MFFILLPKFNKLLLKNIFYTVCIQNKCSTLDVIISKLTRKGIFTKFYSFFNTSKFRFITASF